MAEIEVILDRLQSGELSLEAVFEEFELATRYWQECDRFLAEGQERLELAIEVLEE